MTAPVPPPPREDVLPQASSPTRFGSYRIIQVLGRGGMGVVYLARHLETGRAVALKTVSTPDQRLLQNLRREIRALTEIRHPGVVQILDSGQRDGTPWYAMELIRGEVLTTAVPPATSSHQALEKVILVCYHICQALAYLHGEGFVHRDLKPENILVRSDGWPIIVDFGLLTHTPSQGREQSWIEEFRAGSLHYLSPEQLRGDAVDARADLYSLGCILYRLVTGSTPFQGARPAELMRAHLQEVPRAPTAINPAVPDALNALILSLLQKDLRARPGYTEDVARALLQLLPTPPDARFPLPEASPYLYRPGLVGRTDLLARLTRLLEDATSGTGSCVFLEGEAGAGKTRLARELGRLAAQLDIPVLVGGASLTGTGEGPGQPGSVEILGCLRRPLQQIADWCRGAEPAEAQRILGGRADLLALVEPAFRSFAYEPGVTDGADIFPGDGTARLISILLDTFEAFAEGAPLLLLLDDLHWLDELTVQFLRRLIQGPSLKRQGWVVVGCFRSEHANEALQALCMLPGVQRLPLLPLEPSAVEAAARDMLGVNALPAEISSFLVQQSQGNPLRIAEYLMTAVREHFLTRRQGRWELQQGLEHLPRQWEALHLPTHFPLLVEKRLANLTAPAQRVLEAVAVLGRDTSLALLGDLASLEESDLLLALHQLQRLSLLDLSSPEQPRFRHEALRQVCYGQLLSAQRLALHRKAAALLETHSDVAPARLGSHWQAGEVPERARTCYLRAARNAAGVPAYGEAERLYRLVLGLGTPPGELSGILLELAETVLWPSGQTGEALEAAHLALERPETAVRPPLRAALLLLIGRLEQELGQLERGQEVLTEALEAARVLGDHRLECLCLSVLGANLNESGNMPEARKRHEAALVQAQALDDWHLMGLVLRTLSVTCIHLNDLKAAGEYAEQAQASYVRARDRVGEAYALAVLAYLAGTLGEIERAGQLNERALEIQRRCGLRYQEAIASLNLADIRMRQGQAEAARELAEHALEINQELGVPQNEAASLELLAQLSFLEGDIEAARPRFQDACELLRSVGFVRPLVFALARWVTLERLTAPSLEVAQRRLEEAEELCLSALSPFYQAFVCCERGHLEQACGRDASDWLQRLRGLLAEGGVSTGSELMDRASQLERAVGGARQGRHLWRGQCWEDIPPGLQRWLTLHYSGPLLDLARLGAG